MKKGLVMEGGAMRGMFTCGVIDVFLENGIVFDGAVGVSAGAAFGINYMSGQIGRALRYNQKYMRDKRYCSLGNLIKTGDLFDAKFCYDTLPHELDVFDTEKLCLNPMEFYVVATDANNGEAVYHKIIDGMEDDLLWIRASASIPMVSKTVEVDGYELLDGGIADSIPVKYMQAKGYDKNVVILTKPFGYIRKPSSLGIVSKIFLGKYPAMIKAINDRHIMYNAQTEYVREQELAGKLFVIRPPKDLVIPNLAKDPAVLQRAYDAGRKIALNKLDDVRRFLEI